MTAAGDAVLAVALGEVGYTEDPPGSNNTKYWDWYGGNYGSWCGCYVDWCCATAGYPICAIDSGKGFILVSNGTVHSYQDYEQNIEAERTIDLQPGDVVLFSWYSWDWSGTPGQGGVPVITDPEWAGWIAGDHTGFAATGVNENGYFDTVEGNTSQSSWDNGGAVLYRTDRHISQVCGWWRPLNYGETGSHPITPPEPIRPKEDTMIIRSANDGACFAVSAAGKRHMGGGELEAWMRAGLPLIDVGEDVVKSIPYIDRTLARDPGSGTVYVVGENGKRAIGGAEFEWRAYRSESGIYDTGAIPEMPDV